MLTKDQEYVLGLLRKSLKTEKHRAADEPDEVPEKDLENNPEPEDAQTVIRMILRNGILLTVYREMPEKMRARLKEKYRAAQKQAMLQDYEGNAILKALGDAGMSCIALKGWELRKLYPESMMRQMADLDILVKPYDYPKISHVMESLGYAGGGESSWKHDSFRKDEITVEIHKRLTDEDGAVQVWEEGIWDRAAAVEGNLFRMMPEDEYLFHFVHLRKDFGNGSLGLRRIVDTWLLQGSEFDREYTSEQLKRFGMSRFHERMVQLGYAVMGETEMNEKDEVLLKHAFAYGIYGSGKSYQAGRIARMGGSVQIGKAKSLLAAVLLPYSRMKRQFPKLERQPVLLPYFWMKRIIRFLRGNRKKLRKRMDYRGIGEEDYQEMKRFFEAGEI